MNKIILFLVAVFLFSCSNDKKQVAVKETKEVSKQKEFKEFKEFKEYYDHVGINKNGEPKLKMVGQTDKDGLATGEFIHYSESGILEYKVNHTTNISKKYYTTGELEETGTFNPDSGAHIGLWTSYYKNGNIKVTGTNDEDGEKNSVYKYYNEDGSLEKVETYKNGIKQG